MVGFGGPECDGKSFIGLDLMLIGISIMSSSQRDIDVASYLSEIEKIVPQLSKFDFTGLPGLAQRLVQELKRELNSKESLMKVDTIVPLLEPNSFESLIWAIGILTSAWANWVFSAKANDPHYRFERQEAAMNAQIVLPYVEKTILSAMRASEEIGRNPQNNFRPENIRKLIRIEKARKRYVYYCEKDKIEVETDVPQDVVCEKCSQVMPLEYTYEE